MSGLVSVVVPVFNAKNFLADTIESVLNQTYKDWELILVDDCSTDNSVGIISKYVDGDKRIKLIQLSKNSGSAVARNAGIDVAQGRYLAFLDADDVWLPKKLMTQCKFMIKKNCAFSYTSYMFANQEGEASDRPVSIPSSINYDQALKNPIIWTTTVMLDLKKIPKKLVLMPDVRRGQDAATWWKILRETNLKAYGIDEVLAYYRRTDASLSANKFKAVKRTWYLYRQVENLSLLKSVYVFMHYGYNAVRKRV